MNWQQIFINKKEGFWRQESEKKALSLFQSAAKFVPAYKDFLRKNKINPDKIKTFQNFQLVPPINKKNYLRYYALEKLTWNGNFNKSLIWTATSGSTGERFYFPRNKKLAWQSSITHECFLLNSTYNFNKSTLVIIGFGMGIWIGGLITYQAFEAIGQRGYPISILTPGVNKKEIFNALKNLAPRFHQTILVGYPPFIKDIIDETPNEGINLKKLNLRLIFAAETFSEKFREYIAKKAGLKNLYLDTMNIYGTADLGTMAWETPLSILIRRLAIKNKNLFQGIFSTIKKTPTLAQYNPLFNNFEALNKEIFLTGDSAMPLIRYEIGDHGGIFGFTELTMKLKEFGINLDKESRVAGIKHTISQLPFVYVYERSDFSTTLYGLNIFPEMIRDALLDSSIKKFLSGKFTMITKFDKKHDQYLEINLELQRNKKLNTYLKQFALKKIINQLREKSSEFRELSDHLNARDLIKLAFWPMESSKYFKTGIKQKWIHYA